jgi:polyribonucleotide nucleotidyltransferase
MRLDVSMLGKFSFNDIGLDVEIGKFARQANGSAWIKKNGIVLLSTAVAAKAVREFAGFLPLMVEYRERPSAAGKIPGGYIKREGRLSDIEILVSRLIDRPIRPLFPTYYFNDVQLMSTVLSYDGSFPTSILGLLGTSIALTVSDIPFLGPIGAVQVGRESGKWQFNMSHDLICKSDANIIIAGTHNGISMVEGSCNNLSESEMIDVLFEAHEKIKDQVAWQIQIQKEIGVKKVEVDSKEWPEWEKRVAEFAASKSIEPIFVDNKKERSFAFDQLKNDLAEHFDKDLNDEKISSSVLNYIFDNILKGIISDGISKKGCRIDGRKFDEVRKIDIELKPLPCVHGSAVFQRGETQAISSVTLGTTQDAQKVETLVGGLIEKSFMLHYNFPPFSTGEVKPIRGVGRREVGHGYLAETSFKNVLPSQEDFPYTVRVVVDILESNGSSSMATVCSTSMALMDGGVPLRSSVAGIAMGLIRDSAGNDYVVTDILGTEDALGLMDFKVTGTFEGIMAFQLDSKDKKGFSKALLSKALEQARQARLFILDKMNAVLPESRKNLSELAPRIFSLKVPTDKIGAIIGPAGSIIKEIIATTNTQIDIADDGTVKIFAKDEKSAESAKLKIKALVGDIEIGSVFNGTVRNITDFGMFVEILPGRDGLIHVSSIDRDKKRNLSKLYKPNDKIEVKVVSADRSTGRIRLIAPELEQK